MTVADLAILGVMAVSGLLALMRGFTREVFSIFAWGGSALATLWLFPLLQPVGQGALSFLPVMAVDGITGLFIFLVALTGLSYVMRKLTEKLRGPEPGPFDGTAGFLFGLVRGFVLVCLVYLFYGWVAPSENEPKWLKEAALIPAVKATNKVFVGLVAKGEARPANAPTQSDSREDGTGYSEGSREDLDHLLSTTSP